MKQIIYDSPIGKLYVVSDGDYLVGLWMENQKYFQATLKQEPLVDEKDPVLKKTKKWLDDYFSGKNPNINQLPLKPQGSPFRQEVWKILCDIPYGQVTTYGAIAKQLAKKHNVKRFSAQAVGGAVGHNPISIIIPCHRVVGSNNSLTGYAGGLDKKIYLLEHEGFNTKSLFVPKVGTAL